jgi:hypothetical protein
MASIILITIDSLACGFFIYVLLNWTRETHRKPSPSQPSAPEFYSIRPVQPSHQQKKTVRIATIKEISHQKQTAPRKTCSIP